MDNRDNGSTTHHGRLVPGRQIAVPLVNNLRQFGAHWWSDLLKKWNPPLQTVSWNMDLTGSVLGVHATKKLLLHRISEVTKVAGAINIITVDNQANFQMLND